MAETSIMDLPLELTFTILFRLPKTDILRCKSVCKLWKTYVTDPSFTTVYSCSQEEYLPVILFPKNSFIRIFRLQPRPWDEYTYSPAEVIPGCRKFIQADELRDGYDKLVGSCRGLVCLLHQSKTSKTYDYLSVSNPMTQEFRLLRAPPRSDLGEDQFMFGFSGKTSEYKLLRIYQKKSCEYKGLRAVVWFHARAQVCTVNGSGTDTDWRDIVSQSQTVPSPRVKEDDHLCGVSFKGALHWITGEDDRRLVSFDIDEENIRQIPLPAETNHGGRNLCLGVLRGCLCIFQIDGSYPFKMNIWSMEKYGVMESWVKETVKNAPFGPFGTSQWRTCHPVVHLNHNEMVTLDRDDCGCRYPKWPTNLYSYDREKNASIYELYDAHHRLPDVEDVFRNGGEIAPYVPTFLPLDYLLRGKDHETP